ncbi:hypothetical protein L2E82_16048 [Cichorium intybus]|uniref:Uncharacterized protein n=1 Tax=Cichorium intybus TaxID=13427 RepID=A0ACB9F4Z0_CICIN|nr:hypothetical protein L2E82_16048 [Cichorium intybus]
MFSLVLSGSSSLCWVLYLSVVYAFLSCHWLSTLLYDLGADAAAARDFNLLGSVSSASSFAFCGVGLQLNTPICEKKIQTHLLFICNPHHLLPYKSESFYNNIRKP